jgi:hypothetical protein
LFRLAKDHGRTSLYVVCRDQWTFCGQAMRWDLGLRGIGRYPI